MTILLGSEALTNNFSPALDDALLDMTPHTPSDFNDAFLLPGFTYSDYDSDVHITTISKGGISPMEYLDVVVSVGTVDAGQASAPVYDLAVSNRFPEIGEFVSITAQLTEGNLSKDFAFSWFTNEIPETKAQFLNQPTLTKSFNEKGEYVIRVMVSDMKGGVASSNLVIKVGDYEKFHTILDLWGGAFQEWNDSGGSGGGGQGTSYRTLCKRLWVRVRFIYALRN